MVVVALSLSVHTHTKTQNSNSPCAGHLGIYDRLDPRNIEPPSSQIRADQNVRLPVLEPLQGLEALRLLNFGGGGVLGVLFLGWLRGEAGNERRRFLLFCIYTEIQIEK
jgi:hypothetical protein